MADVKSLSVELAATVMTHGARFVAEAELPSFPTEQITVIPFCVAWNEPTEIASLK